MPNQRGYSIPKLDFQGTIRLQQNLWQISRDVLLPISFSSKYLCLHSPIQRLLGVCLSNLKVPGFPQPCWGFFYFVLSLYLLHLYGYFDYTAVSVLGRSLLINRDLEMTNKHEGLTGKRMICLAFFLLVAVALWEYLTARPTQQILPIFHSSRIRLLRLPGKSFVFNRYY